MVELAQALRRAERFVDAARAVCDAVARRGIRACAVILHRENGEPYVVVDNDLELPDERRLAGDFDVDHALACPVIGANGPFGRIVFVGATPELERELLMISTHLSVWCTEHRIGAVPDVSPRDQLTVRQRQIALLAATGKTNLEIAHELQLSLNTVKVRLKQAFDRLGVVNRTELANVLRAEAPPDDVPPGITRLPDVTVTRRTRG